MRAKFVCYSRPMVYTYLPNFVSVGLFCLSLLAKKLEKPQFLLFFGLGVASWQQSEKVEHGCATKNLPLSNGVKIVSALQRLHGEIGRTISDVQKRDGQTDRQTDKKTQRFWPPWWRVKSDPPNLA